MFLSLLILPCNINSFAEFKMEIVISGIQISSGIVKKIYGPQGKPVSQSYIQRNAIQGDWWKQNKP